MGQRHWSNSYRLEQGRGPVFVDGEASPLLDGGALQRCFLEGGASLACSLYCGQDVRKRLLQLSHTHGGVAYSGSANSASQRPGAGKGVHDVWSGRHTSVDWGAGEG